ncbi:hypothetical protein BKA62DRAFT_369543 [Auriculariales sp. MPI-PUGE-AT-0066]|nr:hypothetical protein BKA62DRAFT_369543 [Auriculariales sp. MPI-PUGE-AT-0066]
MTSGWAELPLELLLQSLETFDSHSEQRYPVLLACALVCRPWALCAQAILFRRVIPRVGRYTSISRHSVNQLVAVLATETPRADFLARHVHAMGLHIGIDVHYRGDDEQHADLDSLSRLLKACPQLRELSITQAALAPPGNVFNTYQMQRIRDHPSMVRLKLKADCNPPAIMYQLLHAWPGLHELDIVAWTLSPTPTNLPPRCSLKSVSAATYGDPSALLAAAAPDVKRLACGLNSLGCISRISHSLKELTVDCTYPLRTLGDEARVADMLASCCALEHVDFQCAAICPATLLDALPATVTWLRIQCTVNATLLANLLRRRPNLKHVEVDMLTVRFRHDYTDLRQVCASSNVRLSRTQEVVAV